MSDTNKKAAIATAIVLLIIAAFWTGFMEKTKKYTISEDFDNITVYGQNSSIKVDDKAYVKCKRNDRVNVNEDTLTVKEESKWFKLINFDNTRIEIYLPDKEYDRLFIDTVSSSVNINDRITFENVEIESTSGSIETDIDVRDKAIISSASGSVKINDLNNRELAVSTLSGSIKLKDVISDESMIIETASGSVKLDKVDSDYIEITAVSGSVNGKILSNKQYKVSTVSGSVNIPLSSGNNNCVIETVSGSIDISE